MQPLSAEIITENLIGDERSAFRRSLRLGVSASSSGEVAMALILNLSETGLLIETLVELAEGEALRIEFPDASASTAKVVWVEGFLAGCEFTEPISTATVSAAQLKAPVRGAHATNEEPASNLGVPWHVEPQVPDDSAIQTAILIVASLISVVAMLIFIAALWQL